MRESKDGETVGITLRVKKSMLKVYRDIASRANLIEIQKGNQGRLTAQDVMRHRLESLPAFRGSTVKKNEGGGNEN